MTYAAVVLLCAFVAGSGASLLEYQEWPATVSHQSKFEVHPSPVHYAAPVYSAPLVQYGAYGYGGAYDGYDHGYGGYGHGYDHSYGLGHEHHLYKRSAHFAPIVSPHAALVTAPGVLAAPHALVLPGAVSHQSRVDYHHSAPYYASPYYGHGYASPYGYGASHVYGPKAYGYHW